jgi:hypothetical protein
MQETRKFYYEAVRSSGSKTGEPGGWKHFLAIANIVSKFDGSKLMRKTHFM